jgi:hypothetical protein
VFEDGERFLGLTAANQVNDAACLLGRHTNVPHFGY